MKRKQMRRHWLYPLLAYASVVLLLLTLALHPNWLFLAVSAALSGILAMTAMHHYRQGRVTKDAYLEYVLVLLAVIFVLITSIKH